MAEFKWNIWTLALLLLSAATVCSSQAEAGSPTDNGGRDFGRRSLPPPPSRNLVRDGSDGGSAAKEPQAPFWKRPERMQEVHVEAVNSRVSHSISKYLPPFPRRGDLISFLPLFLVCNFVFRSAISRGREWKTLGKLERRGGESKR